MASIGKKEISLLDRVVRLERLLTGEDTTIYIYIHSDVIKNTVIQLAGLNPNYSVYGYINDISNIGQSAQDFINNARLQFYRNGVNLNKLEIQWVSPISFKLLSEDLLDGDQIAIYKPYTKESGLLPEYVKLTEKIDQYLQTISNETIGCIPAIYDTAPSNSQRIIDSEYLNSRNVIAWEVAVKDSLMNPTTVAIYNIRVVFKSPVDISLTILPDSSDIINDVFFMPIYEAGIEKLKLAITNGTAITLYISAIRKYIY